MTGSCPAFRRSWRANGVIKILCLNNLAFCVDYSDVENLIHLVG